MDTEVAMLRVLVSAMCVMVFTFSGGYSFAGEGEVGEVRKPHLLLEAAPGVIVPSFNSGSRPELTLAVEVGVALPLTERWTLEATLPYELGWSLQQAEGETVSASDRLLHGPGASLFFMAEIIHRLELGVGVAGGIGLAGSRYEGGLVTPVAVKLLGELTHHVSLGLQVGPRVFIGKEKAVAGGEFFAVLAAKF